MRLALPAAVLVALSAAACATAPKPAPAPSPVPAPTPTPPTPAKPPEPTMTLAPAAFADMPGWAVADLAPAYEAFRRQCALWARRPAETVLASYGGPLKDWLPACQALSTTPDPRAFFEANFRPWRVEGQNGQALLTGYYTPRIEGRRQPEPGFTEPVRPRPADMAIIDLAAFAERLEKPLPEGYPARLTGQVADGKVVPYPARPVIAARPATEAAAFVHPADLYNIQVQGSGHMDLPGGEVRCLSVAGMNGLRWRSFVPELSKQPGWERKPGGLWASIRAYFDAHPDEVGRWMNADPSYVFLAEGPADDCPRGAGGTIVVEGGSLAVDPRFHPYGAPVFAAAAGGGGYLPRLMIAQDTGGAIRRGPLRGDIYMGEGPEAGVRAEGMRAEEVEMWVLRPVGANAGT